MLYNKIIDKDSGLGVSKRRARRAKENKNNRLELIISVPTDLIEIPLVGEDCIDYTICTIGGFREDVEYEIAKETSQYDCPLGAGSINQQIAFLTEKGKEREDIVREVAKYIEVGRLFCKRIVETPATRDEEKYIGLFGQVAQYPNYNKYSAMIYLGVVNDINGEISAFDQRVAEVLFRFEDESIGNEDIERVIDEVKTMRDQVAIRFPLAKEKNKAEEAEGVEEVVTPATEAPFRVEMYNGEVNRAIIFYCGDIDTITNFLASMFEWGIIRNDPLDMGFKVDDSIVFIEYKDALNTTRIGTIQVFGRVFTKREFALLAKGLGEYKDNLEEF